MAIVSFHYMTPLISRVAVCRVSCKSATREIDRYKVIKVRFTELSVSAERRGALACEVKGTLRLYTLLYYKKTTRLQKTKPFKHTNSYHSKKRAFCFLGNPRTGSLLSSWLCVQRRMRQPVLGSHGLQVTFEPPACREEAHDLYAVATEQRHHQGVGERVV